MSKRYIDCGEVHLPSSQFEPLEDDIDININKNKKISIVHISDTHEKHEYMTHNIPDGDILIHTGDFLHKCSSLNKDGTLPRCIDKFNKWFGDLPHKKKIIICGNHEGVLYNNFGNEPKKIHNILHSATHYLQDSEINVGGIKFWGTPWTTNASRNTAFGINKENENELNKLNSKFDLIPNDTDILLHHLPPYNILDLAYRHWYNFNNKCIDCGQIHTKYDHWGSKYLLQQITERVKPIASLYGHVHDSSGHCTKNNILFCNSAMVLGYEYCHKFDVVFDLIQDDDTNDAKINNDNQMDVDQWQQSQNQLNDNRNTLKLETNELKENTISSQQLLNDKNVEINTLKSEQNELNSQNTELNGKVNQLKEKINSLQQSLNNKDGDVNILISENEELKEKFNSLQRSQNHLNDNINTLKSENNELKENNISLQQLSKDKDIEINTLKQSLNNKGDEINELNTKINQLKEENNASQQSLNNKNGETEELKEKCYLLQRESNDKDDEINRLKSENIKLRENMADTNQHDHDTEDVIINISDNNDDNVPLKNKDLSKRNAQNLKSKISEDTEGVSCSCLLM